MAQLELPIEYIDQSNPLTDSIQQVGTSPGSVFWIKGNTILPGQGFAIWESRSQQADTDEVRRAMERVFDTSEQIRKAWPWTIFRTQFDPVSNIIVVSGTTYKSAQEMVASMITPTLVVGFGKLASVLLGTASWVSSTTLSAGVSQKPPFEDAGNPSGSLHQTKQ